LGLLSSEKDERISAESDTGPVGIRQDGQVCQPPSPWAGGARTEFPQGSSFQPRSVSVPTHCGNNKGNFVQRASSGSLRCSSKMSCRNFVEVDEVCPGDTFRAWARRLLGYYRLNWKFSLQPPNCKSKENHQRTLLDPPKRLSQGRGRGLSSWRA